ncbi:ATP-grasp domain-containing protein [bacterium]|nr:ATP-grasp domain-containing protein [bacterium]
MKVAIIYNQDVFGVINTFGMQNKEVYSPKTIEFIADCLEKGGHNVKIIDGNMKVIDSLQEFMPRVIEGERMGIVFNMAYGIQGESRYTHLPSMLEMLGIPYVGSSPSGHALALDKVITKIVMQKHSIPTPNFWVFSSAEEDMSDIVYPVIVKPKMEAVSFGLKIVYNKTELKEAIDFVIKEFQQQALVEQFIRGREFCVGILGNRGNLECFPILEIDLENDPDAIQTVFDKKAKPRNKICPADLPEDLAEEMRRLSKKAFLALELRDFARVDIRMDENNNILLLEINSMASLGDTGSYVNAAEKAGYSYPQLVNKILETAVIRYSYESLSNGKMPSQQTDDSKKSSLAVRVRGFIRSRQGKIEKFLEDIVNTNTHVRNLEGVNAVSNMIWKQLSNIGFSQQIIPQVEIGNLLLFSNSSEKDFDVLFVGNLDCDVLFTKHRQYEADENRILGTKIWGVKGGLAVLVSALQALRFIKTLRKLKIGILLTTDETLQGRLSQPVIEQTTSRASIVIGLKGGGINSSLITSRSGTAAYKCEMNLTKAEKAEDVAQAVAAFSHLAAKMAECTDEARGVMVVPNAISINSSVPEMYSCGDFSISMRFNQLDLCDEIDQKIRQLSRKKLKNPNIKILIEGGVRRPPFLRTDQVESLWKQMHAMAEQLDIRLLQEHRWSSTNLCYSDATKQIIDGVGPIGGFSGTSGEYILKHSLYERAVLLAMFLDELATKKQS